MARPKRTLYIPKEVEPRWSHQLAQAKVFPPEEKTDKKPFSVVFSLKSIDSALDLSQVLQYSLQDCYVRFKRMQGHPIFYIPGLLYDDGLQFFFERKFKKSIVPLEEKKEFFEKEWKLWKEKQTKGILRHLQWIGISCDYQMLKFSLDTSFQKVVSAAFVKLYEEGLLHSTLNLVRWCTECNSLLLPEDQKEQEEEGFSYLIKFPLVSVKSSHPEKETLFLNVFLEKLELIFGIQGFLVPPNDDRFKKFIGRSVLLPFIDREVPILVDSELTRKADVLPIIPGHSREAFRVANRYKLRIANAFNPDGRMSSSAGKEFEGVSRKECRAELFEALKEKELLVRREQDYKTPQKFNRIKCFRCDQNAELILFNGWSLKTGPLIDKLEEHLPDKEARIQRKMPGGTRIGRFLEPLLKKEPYLASGRRAKMFWKTIRTLSKLTITLPHWNGTPVPLWYCEVCGAKLASEELLEKCSSCQGTRIRREQGVISSKFAEWLWPLVSLGWPDTENPTYQEFFPNQLMISSAPLNELGRMVLGSAHFVHSSPFKTLYLSGTIRGLPRRDAHLNLESLIKRYGADSIRFSLLGLVSEGRALKLSSNWYRGGQKFVNKLWNLSLLARKVLPLEIEALSVEEEFPFEDRWILSRLHRTLDKFTLLIEEFQFQKGNHLLWEFTFKSLGFYLEMVKDRLYVGHPESRASENQDPEALRSKKLAQHCLIEVFKILLKITHIVCPFVTEEIWFHLKTQCMAFSGKELMYQDWPHYDSSKVDGSIELEMRHLSEAVRAVRKLLSGYGHDVVRPRNLIIVPNEQNTYEILSGHIGLLRSIFRSENIQILHQYKNGSFKMLEVLNDMTVYLELERQGDASKQLNEVSREMKKIACQIQMCKVHMANREIEKFYRSVFPLVLTRKKVLTGRYQRLKEYAEQLKRIMRRNS